jgi:hypothetical protein
MRCDPGGARFPALVAAHLDRGASRQAEHVVFCTDLAAPRDLDPHRSQS